MTHINLTSKLCQGEERNGGLWADFRSVVVQKYTRCGTLEMDSSMT